MLETDDLDDDYFTPVNNTSLANIFGSSDGDHSVKNTLKYTPPKATPNAEPQSAGECNTECIFACALLAFQWVDNVYVPKGKVGFAILKILKNNSYNILLYNSDKKTISSTRITEKFYVTLREKLYLSFYDDINNYWSIYTTEVDISKILEIFNKLNVTIKSSSTTTQNPQGPIKKKPQQVHEFSSKTQNEESDTDSSVNRKTKASILSRMATMGQSVLPPHTLSTDKTSDSSDNNESTNHHKTMRHKTTKSTGKRANSDKNTVEVPNWVETCNVICKVDEPTNSTQMYTLANGQLIPISNSSTMSYSFGHNANEMNMFISEQRINNTELRINVNKTSDKIDQIIDKLNSMGHKDIDKDSSKFQINILQKLLNEYEGKIKIYEKIISSNKLTDLHIAAVPTTTETQNHESTEQLEYKIAELQQIIVKKDYELNNLTEQMKLKLHESGCQSIQNEDVLIDQITKLKKDLELKDKELLDAKRKCKENIDNNELENQIKYIMNETFQSIAMNFENTRNYSGEVIKNVVASIVKKVTLKAISKQAE